MNSLKFAGRVVQFLLTAIVSSRSKRRTYRYHPDHNFGRGVTADGQFELPVVDGLKIRMRSAICCMFWLFTEKNTFKFSSRGFKLFYCECE